MHPHPVIDTKRTGLKLKIMLKEAGYDVRYIQEYLHLSCPQSIYKWFNGNALPSVEHLSALGSLLGVHMEDLLAYRDQSIFAGMKNAVRDSGLKRLLGYYAGLDHAA